MAHVYSLAASERNWEFITSMLTYMTYSTKYYSNLDKVVPHQVLDFGMKGPRARMRRRTCEMNSPPVLRCS